MDGLTPGSPSSEGDNFISSMETRDDAGYVPFGGGLLLQSVDFFPPIVDDPYRFGQIAAANALSDIYAMGGTPITAMNLVGFPSSLDLGILREILEGGRSKIDESGARLLGGHSVQDDEPKYGLSVTGFVEEDRVVRNAGAKVGDALILTKPLGFGILTTALKRELVTESEIEDAVEMAATLNKAAGAALRETEVSAATDVTGYGFLGHLLEMLDASNVGAVVHRSAVPVWERSITLAREGCYPAGLKNNREYLGDKVSADGVSAEDLLPLHDPQTSGGLLIALPNDHVQTFIRALEQQGAIGAIVGEVVAGTGVRVTS
ncbi:MAG: selenide, water dikinase SelD [Rubrobacter sp.]|nr:selenide, water dikinase SelD [Rubrobacter sp.]